MPKRTFDHLSRLKAVGQPLCSGQGNNLVVAARASWLDTQKAVLSAYPQVGMAGSGEPAVADLLCAPGA